MTMALFIVFCLSLMFALGMLFARLSEGMERVEKFITALSLGAMIGVAFLDLVPEILEEAEGTSYIWAAIAVVLGIVILKLLDRFVPEHEGKEESKEGNLAHIGIMSAVAIMLHNIVEGMTVYSVSSASLKGGLVLALSVALHNIPMGAFIYSTMKNEKRNMRNLVLLSAPLSTLLGGVLMMLLSSFLSPSLFAILMSLALGMVLYIIFWELIPSVLHTKDWKTTVPSLVLGLLLVLVASFLE